MIDKIQPRKLDKDTDQKLVQKTSMIDALNIYVDENLAGDEAGAGVLKPVLGTEALSFTDGFSFGTDEEPSDVRILGSTVDDLTNVLYFYVWSSDATEQGVYAYDHDSVLSDDGGLRKIFTSEVFNFPPDGFVKGDVVYKRERGRVDGTTLPDVDSILYFTDGVNEPRKLDIYRALFGSDDGDIPPMPEQTEDSEPSLSLYKIHDVLCACPKVPMGNIDFNFSADTEKEVSNFDGVPGVQFAMQGVYTDGSVTAIGPYSKIAFPTSVVNRGSAGASKVLNDNVCKIKIPEIQEDIETIKILYRYGNKATFRELAEVPNQQDSDYEDENWDQDLREYSFYNDQISTGVSPSDVAKTFDNLPRQARAQSAISNRLVFSNFKDGFDPYKPEVTTTVLFKKRPAEGVDFTINLLPTIEAIGHGDNGVSFQNDPVGNKAMGFEIDTEEIPDIIPEDTTISIAFSFSPDKNFHVFEARGSFHQSQHVGPASGNFSGLQLDHRGGGKWSNQDAPENEVLCEDIVTQVPDSSYAGLVQNDGQLIDSDSAVAQLLGAGGGTESWTAAYISGQGTSEFNSGGGTYRPGLGWDTNHDGPQASVNAAFGRNFGVGYRADIGTSPISAYPFQGLPFGDTAGTRESCQWAYSFGNNSQATRAAYGTSAAAPLIIQGTKLSFDLSFKITQEISNGKEVVAQAIQDIIVNRPLTNPAQVEFISCNNVYNYSLDVGLTDGRKIFQSDPEKNLITMVTDVGEKQYPSGDKQMSEPRGNINQISAISNDGWKTGENRRLPAGYFILNKAEVKFFFEPESRGANGASTPGIKAFHLSIADVVPDAEDGIYTCVKRPEPTAPWKAYSKASIENFLEGGGANNLFIDYNADIPEDDQYLIHNTFHLRATSLETTAWYYVNAKMAGVIRCSENDEFVEEPFWPCKIDVEDETYQPADYDDGYSTSRYRFSLLDGAGGPGGNPPGSLSAYGRYENNRFGSVASQMIATFYGVHDTSVRSQLINAVPSIGLGYGEDNDYNYDNSANQSGVLDVGVIGGVFREVNDGINDSNDEAEFGPISDGFAFGDSSYGYIKTKTTPRVTQSKIPTQQDVKDRYPASGFGGTDDQAHVVYVLAGPFFTGSIALNPIASAPNGNDGGLKSRAGSALGAKALRGVWDVSGIGNKRDYKFINGNFCPINEDQQWTPRGVWDQTTTMPYIFSGSTSPKVHDDQVTYRSVFPWPVIANNDSVDTEENTIDQVNAALVSNLYGSEGGSGFDPAHPPFGSISWADKPGHAEMGNVATSTSGASSKPIMSFKANANHEFGIIYYDERGRHGRVNHLASVYVPGFSPAERNGITDGGPAHIRMKFLGRAPDWAHYYRIAYSKNTSISKFFQYSAGGAFITQNENPIDSGLNSAKIYVSLNYLQGHPISYSDSWGARSQEGSPVVYQPKEGDKVRVISYQRSSQNQVEKVFAKNIVFDVIGVESLGGEVEGNPLWADPDEDVPENRKGLFLTIKNNPENTGFSYADIEQDNHLWGHNCIIEIFRPTSDLDAEDRLYYEIGPTYRCGNSFGHPENYHLNHENLQGDPIEIVDGDVFFRKTAVNMREFEEGEFIDLIRSESVDVDNDNVDEWVVASEPNFKSIYTEAMSATDLFKSDGISIGRPNKIDNNEKEMMRIASLVHSDKDITKSSKVGYSSFNSTESNDKDLDVAHGEIDYTANTDDSLLIIQKNKVGHIPVDRNLISTADNEPSLISSSKFLGTARYYAGRGGSDGHPESIAMANGNAYFAHKTDGKVFRASGANGLLEISNKGLKTFFRNLFSLAGKNDKIVGGYDPIKEEYLINVQAVEALTPQNGTPITQQDTPLLTFNTEFLENSSTTDNIVDLTYDPSTDIGIDDGGAGLGGDDGPG